MTADQLPLFSIGEPDPLALALVTLRRGGWSIGPRMYNEWFGRYEWRVTPPKRLHRPGRRETIRMTESSVIALAAERE